jgi:hypothetical protein
MNEIELEAKLRADGYTEIETQDLQPRTAKGQHGIRSRSVASFSRAPLSSRRTISGPYTDPGRSSLSTTNTRMTSRSVPRAHASWSVASLKKRDQPAD